MTAVDTAVEVFDPASATDRLRFGINSASVRLRDALDYLEEIQAALDAGNGAAVVQGIHDLTEELHHNVGDHHRDDIVNHLMHLARGYANGDPEDRCCSIGIAQEETLTFLMGPEYPPAEEAALTTPPTES